MTTFACIKTHAPAAVLAGAIALAAGCAAKTESGKGKPAARPAGGEMRQAG